MAKQESTGLSRRERQIMDILYRRHEATVAEVQEDLPDPPSAGAVRSALRILIGKGEVTDRQEGPRKVYRPSVPRETARKSALRHLLSTFFQGSREKAVRALLDPEDASLSEAELERIASIVDEARSSPKEGG